MASATGQCVERGFAWRCVAVTDELDETIRTSAEGPKSVSGDSGSVQQHGIPDQIAADRYLASKKASRSKGLGVRMTKVVPPGAV
jgi:hypothetical protein